MRTHTELEPHPTRLCSPLLRQEVQESIHQQRQVQPITPHHISQTLTVAPWWTGGNCHSQLCPPGRLPWDANWWEEGCVCVWGDESDPREGWEAMRSIYLEQTEGVRTGAETCVGAKT